MSERQPAYKILTWGCQMNDDDSQQMANLLEQMGYRPALEESDADIILLNTCSVRAMPEQKVRSKLGEFRLMKLERPNLIVCVCGCMAQREGKKLLARGADLVLGTAVIHELPMLIEQIRQGRRRIVAADLPERGNRNGHARVPRVMGEVGLKAFVPVMYGCNNFCAYCVVPYARGPERSRAANEIVAEIADLIGRGCKEVTLIGQNVNSYSPGDTDFAGLLEMVNEIEGLERIRFMTSHPKDLNDRLIEAMTLPKVCERLHLPLQSGDDEVLRRMGRGYTVEHYRSLVERLRDRVPGISLTTDVMVGFPGETEGQFRNTMRAVQEIQYDAAFTFLFNPRPGTAAAGMDDQIEGSIKKRRLSELIAIQNEITLEKGKAQVGQVFEALVEGRSEKDPTRITGYTRTNKTVNFPGDEELKGRLVNVRVVSAHPWGYMGEMADGLWLNG